MPLALRVLGRYATCGRAGEGSAEREMADCLGKITAGLADWRACRVQVGRVSSGAKQLFE